MPNLSLMNGNVTPESSSSSGGPLVSVLFTNSEQGKWDKSQWRTWLTSHSIHLSDHQLESTFGQGDDGDDGNKDASSTPLDLSEGSVLCLPIPTPSSSSSSSSNVSPHHLVLSSLGKKRPRNAGSMPFLTTNFESQSSFLPSTIQNTVHSATKYALQKLNAKEVCLHNIDDLIEDSNDISLPLMNAIARSSQESTYKFDFYKKSSKKSKDDPTESSTDSPSTDDSLPSISVFSSVANGNEQGGRHVFESMSQSHGTILARELGNLRAGIADPSFIEDFSQNLVDFHNKRHKDATNGAPDGELLKLTSIVGCQNLEAHGMNMLAAVGQGCDTDPLKQPRLLMIEYNNNSLEDNDTTTSVGAEDNIRSTISKKTAIVGKGVCFDTGGLNLKPTGFIEEMHMDMCGAAATLGALHSVALERAKGHHVFVLALAENAIGPDAVKPHEILESHKGISVEVNNTDAEGRLCLADAMSYVQDKHPDVETVIDIATLTGGKSYYIEQ